MSWNTFGRVFRFTTWGESHGPALGVVVDGCPPGIALSEADIQPFMDARKPGQSKYTTQRREADEVRILSGVFDGKTTGTPISLMIENTDQRSKDYSEVAKSYRPGHADYTYDAKYGFRDYRGGGRSSARETAARVAAGAIARKVIPEVEITAWVEQIGGVALDYARFDKGAIRSNPFFCPDPETVTRWEDLVDGARKSGSSLGALVTAQAEGVPAGWGAPVYAKLGNRRRFRCCHQHGRKQCGPDAPRCGRRRGVPGQPCRRHRRRHFHRPARHLPRGVQADQLDPDAGGHHYQRG